MSQIICGNSRAAEAQTTIQIHYTHKHQESDKKLCTLVLFKILIDNSPFLKIEV